MMLRLPILAVCVLFGFSQVALADDACSNFEGNWAGTYSLFGQSMPISSKNTLNGTQASMTLSMAGQETGTREGSCVDGKLDFSHRQSGSDLSGTIEGNTIKLTDHQIPDEEQTYILNKQ